MSDNQVWVVLIIVFFVYSLLKLYSAKDPKDELLKAKQLLDENLITADDYEKIKDRLIKKIVSK